MASQEQYLDRGAAQAPAPLTGCTCAVPALLLPQRGREIEAAAGHRARRSSSSRLSSSGSQDALALGVLEQDPEDPHSTEDDAAGGRAGGRAGARARGQAGRGGGCEQQQGSSGAASRSQQGAAGCIYQEPKAASRLLTFSSSCQRCPPPWRPAPPQSWQWTASAPAG